MPSLSLLGSHALACESQGSCEQELTTQEQLDFLREHGCEEIQGYLLSPPLPPDQFLQFIVKHVATDAGRRFISFRRFAT